MWTYITVLVRRGKIILYDLIVTQIKVQLEPRGTKRQKQNKEQCTGVYVIYIFS